MVSKVDFGSNSYGIKTAAKTYFNTTPKELTTGQAAVLVGAANFANPRAMETIAEEMAAWMDKNGVKTLDEIRGCARSNG